MAQPEVSASRSPIIKVESVQPSPAAPGSLTKTEREELLAESTLSAKIAMSRERRRSMQDKPLAGDKANGWHANTKPFLKFCTNYHFNVDAAFMDKMKIKDPTVFTATAVMDALEATDPARFIFQEDIN